MFLAKVTAVQVDESLLDEKGKLDLNKAHLVAYSHGEYQTFDNILGTFGYSVKKKDKKGKKEALTKKGSSDNSCQLLIPNACFRKILQNCYMNYVPFAIKVIKLFRRGLQRRKVCYNETDLIK